MPRLSTDRRDLYLDPVNWDLEFENRDLKFSSGVNGVGQSIKFKLQLLKEEWFLDRDAGFPWFQETLGQKLNLERQRQLFFDAVATIAEVKEIDRLALEFNSTNRSLKVDYQVSTIFGDTIADTLEIGVRI